MKGKGMIIEDGKSVTPTDRGTAAPCSARTLNSTDLSNSCPPVETYLLRASFAFRYK